MQMSQTAKPIEELAYREDDGIEVSLLWERATDAVWVAVRDCERDTDFTVIVPPGKSALAVFRHPYAYIPNGLASPAA
jgi:hypothetical protein